MRKLTALVAGAMMIMPVMAGTGVGTDSVSGDNVIDATDKVEIPVNCTVAYYYRMDVVGQDGANPFAMNLNLTYPTWEDTAAMTVGVTSNFWVNVAASTNELGIFDPSTGIVGTFGWGDDTAGNPRDYTVAADETSPWNIGGATYAPLPGATYGAQNDINVKAKGSLDSFPGAHNDGKLVLTVVAGS